MLSPGASDRGLARTLSGAAAMSAIGVPALWADAATVRRCVVPPPYYGGHTSTASAHAASGIARDLQAATGDDAVKLEIRIRAVEAVGAGVAVAVIDAAAVGECHRDAGSSG